jgi:dUTP pyrophosphatase
MEIRVCFKRLRPNATVPTYAHGSAEDAGLDLTYCGSDTLELAPGARILCPTGIAIQLPQGFEGQIRSRSGLAISRGLTVLNAPGTIDPGYRGEISVLLINLSNQQQKIEPGERVAQLVVAPYAGVHFEELEKLEQSERNQEGFGSTGV